MGGTCGAAALARRDGNCSAASPRSDDLPVIELPRNARAPEGHVGECGKCGGGHVNVVNFAADAAVDDLDLNALVAVRNGRGERDVALHNGVGGADTVDEAVAANLSVTADGGLDGGNHETGVAEGHATRDEGAADGVAVLLSTCSWPIVEHFHRDSSGEGVVVVDISACPKTLTVVGHVSGVGLCEELVSRVVNGLGELLEVRVVGTGNGGGGDGAGLSGGGPVGGLDGLEVARGDGSTGRGRAA